ncbi:MAG: hypothetical protein U0230_14865 [Polyangiales bacterium]
MNTTLKQTLVTMATAALGFAAGCGHGSDNPSGTQAASGGETSTAQGQGGCHAGGCHAGGCQGQAQPAQGGSTGAGSCGGHNTCGAATTGGSTSGGTTSGTTTTP